MKAFAYFISLLALGLFSITYANISTTNYDNKEIVTRLYKDFFEKNDVDNMDKYLAKNISFQKDFSQPVDYDSLKKHLLELNQQCVTLKMLPFDKITVDDDNVTVLYTQSCVDKTGNTHKKRIMTIMKVSSSKKISRIWAVTHEDKA